MDSLTSRQHNQTLGGEMKKETVLNYFGGVTKTAEALGISKGSVSLWGEEIPQGRAYQIESLTGGLLKAMPETKPEAGVQP